MSLHNAKSRSISTGLTKAALVDGDRGNHLSTLLIVKQVKSKQ